MVQGYDSRFQVLAPKLMLDIFRKYEQGNPIFDAILPPRDVPGEHFTFKLYGRVGHMAARVGRGAAADDHSIQYEEKISVAYEYRESTTISDRDIKAVGSIVNVLANDMESIAESIVLRREYEALQTLLGNNPYNDLTAGGMPTAIGGYDWSDPGTDVVASLVDSRAAIKKAAKVSPDTLVISVDDESNYLKHPELRQYQQAGNVFNRDLLLNGQIGRIEGMDILVHNMTVDINPGTPRGVTVADYPAQPGADGVDVQQMFGPQNRAIVCVKGPNLGFTGMEENFATDVWQVKELRSVRAQAWQIFGHAIVRPNKIIHIKTDGTA